jgi:hypothetical protein
MTVEGFPEDANNSDGTRRLASSVIDQKPD